MVRITGEKILKKANPKVVAITSALTAFAIGGFYLVLTWSVDFTSSVDFCTVNCHEMEEMFREWRVSSHYDNNTGVVAECSDCHLPTGFLAKLKAKTIFGVRDTYVHYLGDPENLDRKEMAEMSRHSMTNDSCIKCHKNPFPSGLPRGGFLAHSKGFEGDKGKCVHCHRNIVHKNKMYFG